MRVDDYQHRRLPLVVFFLHLPSPARRVKRQDGSRQFTLAAGIPTIGPRISDIRADTKLMLRSRRWRGRMLSLFNPVPDSPADHVLRFYYLVLWSVAPEPGPRWTRDNTGVFAEQVIWVKGVLLCGHHLQP